MLVAAPRPAACCRPRPGAGRRGWTRHHRRAPLLVVARARSRELGWPGAPDHLELGTMVGAGSYGIVREASHRGAPVAVKVLKKTRGSQARGKVLRKLAREIDLLAKLQGCRNVVQLLAVYEDEAHAYLVCELCRGGDLERVLMERGPFSERAAARVIHEALKTIAACHAQNVIHGDVKPANFLLRQFHADPVAFLEAAETAGAWLKSVDFGCSQVVREQLPLTRRTGTPVYMAPEIFQRSYGLEADLWSVGIMFYQLIALRFPFWESLEECRNMNVHEVMEAVLACDIPLDYGPWQAMSPAGLDLLRQLTRREPAERISAAAALEHAWFKQQLTAAPPAQPLGSSSSNNIIPHPPKLQRSPAEQPQPAAAPEQPAAEQQPPPQQQRAPGAAAAVPSKGGKAKQPVWQPGLAPVLAHS